MKHEDLSPAEQDAVDAAAFRRLIAHLDSRKDVQNIDLMILADFCRNCLAKWYRAAGEANGLDISDAEARARIYGMTYEDWKANFQTPATPEQLKAMETRKRG
ncbi:DUF1244 domain-containing protein [Hyphobacterium indicum]|uniref:DUF1244 domain-containing protein n=1 Tax=Hyphobacterium indicum TaxID=2162714 RepID=UPI000D658071|nr:DUF1244 domain-containing protein [Hyphobacterium indicum]